MDEGVTRAVFGDQAARVLATQASLKHTRRQEVDRKIIIYYNYFFGNAIVV